MNIRSFMKTAGVATAAGLLATMATLSLTTIAPAPSQADIPAPLLAQAVQGQVPSLAPMLKPVLPAVVNIAVVGKAQPEQQQNPLLNDPFFRRFFDVPDGQGPQQQQPREAPQAIGSGVIVDAAKGYVITNNHVVADAEKIMVRLNDDREIPAKLVGTDPATDLAVLKIETKNLTALSIADSDKLEVGDFVVAIGSPFGLRQTVTSGIVSGLGRQGLGEGYEDFIQTDASINPGNSGGALINLKGELVGINSQILSRSGGNIGIGFAIPTNLVKSVMAQLIENGAVVRGRIGIQGGQELTPELIKAFKIPDGKGALIGKIVPDSPASKAGLQDGDVVVEANGKPIKDFAQLRYLVGLLKIGDKVNLKIFRDGKPKEVTVVVGKNVDEAKAAADNLHPALKGATFGALAGPAAEAARAAGVKGVLVSNVDPRSVAAKNGLRPNDVILSVNRFPTPTVAEFERLASQKDGQLLLQVLRGSGAFYLVVE
ncbi:DegQ family serine endoprotease [Nevskia sp.]|uniref:DegQ family serine endoprotease n=1 Tax=Nevskia sp. TaxID=1929292 RepID=UPI0025FB2546|nr:DegQ family serine endoprotease [Nevskia sp.]